MLGKGPFQRKDLFQGILQQHLNSFDAEISIIFKTLLHFGSLSKDNHLFHPQWKGLQTAINQVTIKWAEINRVTLKGVCWRKTI